MKGSIIVDIIISQKNIFKTITFLQAKLFQFHLCSEFFPQFIWIATGGIHNLSRDKSKVLKGRNVILFPDVAAYDLWNDKIPKLTSLATFRTSTLLEKNATEQEWKDGLDIADYLLRTLS